MSEGKQLNKRFKINQLCEIYMGREIYVPVKAINISENGISFSTEEYLSISSLVEFQLALYIGRKSKTINCQGVIRRIDIDDTDFVGTIEFSNMTDENRKIIKDYLKEV